MEKLSYQITTKLSKKTESFIIANKKGKKNLPFFIPYALIRSLFLARKVDVVHIGDPVLSIIGFFIKKIFKNPIIVTLHGLDLTYNSRIYQWYIEKFGKQFNKYICISQRVKEEAQKKGFKNTVIIPIGVDIPSINLEYAKTNLEKEFRLDIKNKKILLTVGRLVKRKGVAWFIENVLPNLEKKLIYIVVGDGREKENILKAIKKNNLEKRVFVMGKVSEKNLKIIYNTSDIFVMPNIRVNRDTEGFGIVALEAASYGLPVIASDLEGIKDAVIDKKTGFLVRPEDAKNYILKINELLNLPKLKSNEFKNDIIKQIRLNYSWNNIINKYYEIFKAIMYEKN
jgi:phosphatidylinositol alpha-1,6-mannosyltransferase